MTQRLMQQCMGSPAAPRTHTTVRVQEGSSRVLLGAHTDSLNQVAFLLDLHSLLTPAVSACWHKDKVVLATEKRKLALSLQPPACAKHEPR